MKYTLQENAMSSFHLAIENFKKFFYRGKQNRVSENDEARKLCAIFLENSIELFLKALLVEKDEMSIYIFDKYNTREEFYEIRKKYNKSIPLEDILVRENKNFKTITYTKACKDFQEKYYHSDIMNDVFEKLGVYRNRLTHFGINEEFNNEYSIVCIETFVVIYQHLFRYLKKLDKISGYMTSDDAFTVSTLHGPKPLIDIDGIYNNVIDFLDELTELSGEICLGLRINDEKYKIRYFEKLLSNVIKSEIYETMTQYYRVNIEWNKFENGEYCFEISDSNGVYDTIGSEYSSHFNATNFIGESGLVYFRILHDDSKIIVYNNDVFNPDIMKPQLELSDWEKHVSDKKAYQMNLSLKSINETFEQIFITMRNFYENGS